jgi:hypothetical protein
MISCYPTHDMVWVTEVEASHASRFTDILVSKNIHFFIQKPFQSHSPPSLSIGSSDETKKDCSPWLYYTTYHLLSPSLNHSQDPRPTIPTECCKYIHKIFYLPHSASDLKFLHSHPSFQRLLLENDGNAILKVVASPKSLERYVTELLIFDTDEDNIPRPAIISPNNIHPSKYSHLIQVIYSPLEGIFRWGIISKESAQEYQLLSVTLIDTIDRIENSLTIPPICRAYYKIQEILGHHFPLWGWLLPDYSQFLSVDIGSSPGGWTQFLLSYSRYVLSIDPGKMDSRLEVQCNRDGDRCMKHVPHLAESDECRRELIQLCCQEETISSSEDSLGQQQYLRVSQPITMCVCDVNFEPHLAAAMLAKSIIPFMKENERIPISSSSPLSSLADVSTRGGSSHTSLSFPNPFFSYVIITLKLQKNPSERIIQKSFANVQNILTSAFQSSSSEDPSGGGEGGRIMDYSCDFRMIYLNANSKNERTVVCRITRREVNPRE